MLGLSLLLGKCCFVCYCDSAESGEQNQVKNTHLREPLAGRAYLALKNPKKFSI